MKISTLANKAVSLLVVLLLWYVLSKIYPPIIVPSINEVIKKLLEILTDKSMLKEILATLVRLLTGFSIGIVSALLFTFVVSKSKCLKEVLLPIVEFLQVIPPISWLVLAILWLGINGKPSIFIVSVSIFCIMEVSLVNSLKNIDKKLLEIATVFRLDKNKKWRYIIIPSLYSAFENAFIICLGISIKLIVMAEVLTINTGIGGGISTARVNLETDGVIAWTIIVILLYYFLGGIFKWLKRRKCMRAFWYQKLLVKATTTK